MDLPYILIPGLCLIGLATRTAYEYLKRTGRIDPKNPVVFAVVFAAMCLMLVSWPFMCPIDPWKVALPNSLEWIGIGMLTAGLGLALGGLFQLRGLENIDHLVTGGLFAKIRHPMYTGFILWILGWVVRYGALASFMVALLCISNILYWRRLEEEKLESQFGEAYRSYRQATWI